MDIDLSSREKLKEERQRKGLCLCCGDVGHFAKDCPKASWNRGKEKNPEQKKRFDVRTMTQEEKDELLAELNKKEDFAKGQE